jgi:hypothetical protein
MIIGKSAARSSRRNVGDRPKTMCRQKLRTEGPAAGHPLYLAFLIGRTKSTLNSAILRFSAHDHFLSLCTDAGRVRPSTRTLLAFSRRGPCVPSRSARGRRMLFIRFINRAVQAVWRSHHEGRKQARDSGHSPFRGPARGRSPRARISILAPFNGLAAAPTVDRSSSIGAIDHRAGFSFSLCVTLAPKPTLKSLPSIHMRCRMPASLRATATIAHNMLDRLATRRPQARSADHFLTRSRRLAAASQSASRTLTSPCLVIRPS